MITIIIPIYNSQRYLDKCLDSVINQSFSDIEIILVNDGSSDESGKICDEYKQKDSRIKVIHKENGGVSSARNVGLKMATGDFIGFVDSDDYINKEMFKVLFNDIKENDCDVSICNWYYEIDGELRLDKTMLKDYKVLNNISAIEELLKDSFKGFLCNKLFKKELFSNVKFEHDLTMCEDYLAVYQVLKRAKRVSINPTPLYFYVMNTDSATFNANNNFNYKNHKSSEKVFRLIHEDILHNYFHLRKLAQFAVARNSVITVCEICRSNIDDKGLLKSHKNIIMVNIYSLLSGNKSNIKIKIYGLFIAFSANLFKCIYKNLRRYL
ncbi:glycosyltransferase [Bacillus sp. ISL-35]|uniref:glycosyltransferase family 2 protein n=1 Tax=Bacillus sp. ISL-35 TaxID=2819122 RepID=UPI001BE8D7BF|nr:glycosyltransferase [Bacillus sp. ISL-35]MBT2678822.1 glycosyltransferase [Bacillus sp. ISL-35]MBT2703814.1 glycosyltransferase [Chryseobacterium sp. ISL-80]